MSGASLVMLIVAVLLGTGALVLAPVAVSLLLRRRLHRLAPEDRQYLAFCERLGRMGVVREPWESPSAFAARAARKLPRGAAPIPAITARYEALSYQPPTTAELRAQQARDLKRQIRRLQLAY